MSKAEPFPVYSARIHGISGAERELIERIDHPEINDLEDYADFKKNYPILRKQMISESFARVESHLSDLETELGRKRLEKDLVLKSKTDELNRTLQRLESEQTQPPRERHFLEGAVEKVSAWARNWKIKRIRNGFQNLLVRSAKKQTKLIVRMEVEISRIEDNLQTVAYKQVAGELRPMDDLSERLESEKHFYYGALGERDVIQKLTALPTAYHVVNDYRKEFGRPIYNRAEDDRIFSVQVDHVVVGPTGVFVIETKNWSDESLSSDVHFSPIRQVRRAGFALFVLLNQAMNDGEIDMESTGWGARKISVKTAVVFRNKVPQGEYQFVKVLGIERLNSYLTYGKHEFSSEEIGSIVSYLLSGRTTSFGGGVRRRGGSPGRSWRRGLFGGRGGRIDVFR